MLTLQCWNDTNAIKRVYGRRRNIKCWIQIVSPDFHCFDMVHLYFEIQLLLWKFSQLWHTMLISNCCLYTIVATGWALQVLSSPRRRVHPQKIQKTPNQIPGMKKVIKKKVWNQRQRGANGWGIQPKINLETHGENVQEGGTMKENRRRLERVNEQQKEAVKEREWKTRRENI